MRFLPCLTLAIGVALVGVCATATGLVGLPEQLDLRNATRELAAVSARRQQLDRTLTLSMHSHQEKERVTREVIAGRLSLADAAACFEQARAEFRARADREAYPFGPLEEKKESWGGVILWVRAALADDPDRAATVIPRLEAEYRAYFGEEPPTS